MPGRLATLAIAALSGTLFGFGLTIAQMTDPQKIINFLDIAAIPQGNWDPRDRKSVV